MREHRLERLVYLGDDVTDAHAFRALAGLRQTDNVQSLSIGVVGQETPLSVRQLADAYYQSGQTLEATKVFRRIQPIARKHVKNCRLKYGEEGRQTLFAWEQLAVCLERLDRFEEVEEIASCLLPIWQELGITHEVAVWRSLQGACHQARSEFDQAFFHKCHAWAAAQP